MIFTQKVWEVDYVKRRPTLKAPLTSRDYGTILVGGFDEDGAKAAFEQRFPPQYRVLDVRIKSEMGFG